MKKQMYFASAVLFAAMMMSSCGSSENGTQSDETEVMTETDETTATSALERDALRAAELSCLAQANVVKGKAEGLTTEEVQALNMEYNLELTEINDRFNADYDDDENKAIFQQIFQEAFSACSGN